MKVFKSITFFIVILIAVLTVIHFVLLKGTERKLAEVDAMYESLREAHPNGLSDMDRETLVQELDEIYNKEKPFVDIQQNIHDITVILAHILCFFVAFIFLHASELSSIPWSSRIGLFLPLPFFLIPFLYELFTEVAFSTNALKFFSIPGFVMLVSLLLMRKPKEFLLSLLCTVFVYTPLLMEFYSGRVADDFYMDVYAFRF